MTHLAADQLVLGIDGGGAKTAAWLALRDVRAGRDSISALQVVGRGVAGPSNPRAVGSDVAEKSLAAAVEAAFGDAGVRVGPVAAACIATAGAGRDAERNRLEQWAQERNLAHRVRAVHDAMPVLAAAAPDGCGVALIAGTGSFAFGVSATGHTARAGGWGYVFGDEGSGYDVGRAALAAVARAADGRGPQTELTAAVLHRLGLQAPADLIDAVYGAADVRGAVAALADVVTSTAAGGDAVAVELLGHAAKELAQLVHAVAVNLSLDHQAFPLGLAGGLLVNHPPLQSAVQQQLCESGLEITPVVVEQPVAGAVLLAQRLAMGRD